MALHHDHQHDDQPPSWPDDDPCCPDEPGVRLRAITFQELEGYLDRLANPPAPAPLLGPHSSRRIQQDAGFLGSHGRPGASAMAQYRRRRATDWRTWRATLPQRLAGVLAVGVLAALAATVMAGPGLARLAGPATAIGLAWLLRFRPSADTLAWRYGAEGERRTARLLAPLERKGFQVFHDLAVPGSAANVDHVVVGPTGVYVIDSKRYRGQLRYTGGRLWHGGWPLDRTLATLWWEATQVAEALAFGPDWFPFPDFASHVEQDQLPSYCFIEPNHRPPVHLPATPGSGAEHSNNQHPANNLVPNADYDSYTGNGGDFERGEQLIATVYEVLRSNPAVFERTLLLITYDEHGGCYDHVPPPMGVPSPGDPVSRGWLGSLLAFLLRRKADAFDFTMLGPRVPAVVVSPYIAAGTVTAEPRDHASIPATLRALFAPQAGPLTKRDQQAIPFHSLVQLEQPRRGPDLPDLSSHLPPVPPTRSAMLAAEAAPPGPEPPVPDYYRDFVALAEMVARQLPAAEVPPDLGPRAKAHQVTVEFTHQADQARTRPR